MAKGSKNDELYGNIGWDGIRLILKHALRALLYGPPGTGKTREAFMSLDKGEPSFAITITEDTPAAELRGHFVPSGPGKFAWLDGPCLKWWDQGGLLVINEIDKASADALSLLFAILDPKHLAALTLPTGETVKPRTADDGLKWEHRVIATMNGLPEELPEPLRSRLGAMLFVPKPHDSAYETLPQDYRQVAQNLFDSTPYVPGMNDPVWALGFRAWEAFVGIVEGMKGVGDYEKEVMAAKAIWGPTGVSIIDAVQISRRKAAPKAK